MIGANLTLTKAFWAPGAQPTPLSLGTSDPRWWSMRDLWSAAVPALQRYPSKVPDLEFPAFPGLTKEGFCTELKGWTMYWGGILKGRAMDLTPVELTYVVSHNFNKQLFGTEFTKGE